MEKFKKKEKKKIIVPEKIKKEINEKGFYLYRWITNDEIKMSIERDFLKILKYIGPALAIISILAYFIASSFYVFLSVIFLGVGLIISYLLGISIYRSFLLIKNSFVVVSDTSVSVGGKVLEINDLDKLNDETKYISKVFEEKLFGNSWLSITKESFYKEVSSNLFSGFAKIWKGLSGKSSGKGGILIILLYLVYVIVLSISYFLGVLLLWSFTLLLSFINKIILKIVGNKAIIINNLFINIDKSSIKLIKRKDDVYNLLEDALNNEWKDGLLTKINKSLELVNSEVEYSIESSRILRKEIEDSKYKTMMNFSVYNSWLRKQIKDPLVQIKELLLISLEGLSESKKDILLKLEKIKRKSLISNLELQVERLDLQKESIEKNITSLDLYLKKLNND